MVAGIDIYLGVFVFVSLVVLKKKLNAGDGPVISVRPRTMSLYTRIAFCVLGLAPATGIFSFMLSRYVSHGTSSLMLTVIPAAVQVWSLLLLLFHCAFLRETPEPSTSLDVSPDRPTADKIKANIEHQQTM